MCGFSAVFPSYMACTASTYGADSLTNRWPAPLTRTQPGRLRSARQKYGPPGSGIDGPHQASSISPVAAPSCWPATIPSPVFPAAPVVQPVPIGDRWYLRRISSLRSNPPVAISTPRLALSTACSPVTDHPHAGDPAVGDDQAGQRGVEPYRYPAGGEPGPQPGRQGLPEAEHPVPEQAAAR